jgi:DNA-binding transcriptional LysR family regulator
VHPDHPWTRQKVVPLAHVSREPFILREADSGTRRVFAGILEQNGFREANLQEVAEIGSTAAVKEAVKAGIGISIISRRAVEDDIACGRIAVVGVEDHVLQRPFYLVRRKNRQLSPVASVFRDYLLARGNRDEK